ncbi:MAG: carboxymuconolactone decarboxylase family protein [Dehalococcoidia bacterium]|nr:carboxymuconolactone decarboxylase family protein [Dehalococcoidia bacterium]
MSRISLVQADKATPEIKDIFARISRNGALVINLYRALAHNPELLRNFIRLGGGLITATSLSPKLRELAILRIARLCGSDYEWAQHYPIGLQSGISREQAEDIIHWNDSERFSTEERAILQYTDEVTQNVTVKDATFNSLRNFLDEQATVELTASIGYWNMVARILVPLQVDIDTRSIGSAEELTGRKD